MPGVYLDKEVDDSRTKNLSSPCTRDMLDGSTCLHSNLDLNMESMLVLFFTILKLITFSHPKLCYVPAVFPTQPQPYTGQDYSVPSSAHCPVLATTMERSLTRTSSRQGYLSGMCDSQRNIAARENKCGVEIYGSLRNDAGPLKVNKV